MTGKTSPKSQTPVHILGSNPTVRFAAQELTGYLSKMTGIKHTATLSESISSEQGIYLGTVEDFESVGMQRLCEKSELDDAIVLKTEGKRLFITGSNPRSVLLATYHYLRLQGAEWLWPGEDGEIIPSVKKVRTEGFDLKERASYRHRAVCIEGAVTPEIVIEFIDWMAKHRMNGFHLQFKHSQYFYNRYYARRYNPLAKPLPEMSIEDALKADGHVIKEMKKRGMILEMVGHGFTCGAIGIDWVGWDVYKGSISEEQRELTALVGGKRGLHQGIPVNTELCYSNPKAFNALVNHVVQYAQDHPKVGILHFWLSDGWNNHCECAECRKFSPSDWEVRLVDAIAEKMGKLRLNTRLVFLSYSNTLWPPTQNKIENKYGNIIFMFAPITRCFVHSLAEANCISSAPSSKRWIDSLIDSLQPPSRNKIVWPRTNYEHVQLLRGWKKYCETDSFIFDYHFGHILDFFGGDIGKVLWRDIRDLEDLGLNGIDSCQTLRAFYPTGIPMAILAETTWNNKVTFEEVRRRYLETVFGEDGQFVSEYLDKIHSFFDAARNYEHRDNLLATEKGKLQELLRFVEESRPRLEKIAEKQKDTVRKKSAFHLLHYTRYVGLTLEAAILHLDGENEKAGAKISEIVDHFLSKEDELLKVADASFIARRLESLKARMKAGSRV